MVQVVSIDRVIPRADASSKYAVNKMKSVLQKQGQIEPLQVRAVHGDYITMYDDPWGNEIVYAARELGWPTLLVTTVTKYEF